MLSRLVPRMECTETQLAMVERNWTEAEDSSITDRQSHQREAPPLCWEPGKHIFFQFKYSNTLQTVTAFICQRTNLPTLARGQKEALHVPWSHACSFCSNLRSPRERMSYRSRGWFRKQTIQHQWLSYILRVNIGVLYTSPSPRA